MPRVSSKRQITLPAGDCAELGIAPGDEVEILRYGNQFNIVKKTPGAADGILAGIKANQMVSEQESLYSRFE